MVTSTGRQALLSNLYRNDAVTGLKEPVLSAPPRRAADMPPPTLPVAGNNPTSSSSNLLSETLSSGGGDDTKRSFSLCRTLISPLFSFFLALSGGARLGSESMPRSSEDSSRQANRPRRSVRLRSMRRVLRRRRWMTGLADGLLVGLAATTAHCVARILNFCKVGILFIHTQKNYPSLFLCVNSFVWLCVCGIGRCLLGGESEI